MLLNIYFKGCPLRLPSCRICFILQQIILSIVEHYRPCVVMEVDVSSGSSPYLLLEYYIISNINQFDLYVP